MPGTYQEGAHLFLNWIFTQKLRKVLPGPSSTCHAHTQELQENAWHHFFAECAAWVGLLPVLSDFQ